MTTALITGGAGFIGSRLARLLASQGTEVVLYDNLHPQVHGASPVPPVQPAAVTLVRGDVRDGERLRAVVAEADPDIVFHLAAETGTGQSYDEPARYCDVNVQGTCHLVEALRFVPRRRRVVLAGSRAVYGEGACLDDDGRVVVGNVRTTADLAAGRYRPRDSAGRPLTPCPTPETLPPAPASVYAATKLMQEHLLEQCAAGTDTEVVLLRFQNVYGPGQSLHNAYTGVLSIFARQIMDGRTLDIYEDGAITRDFVYVDDVVRSLALAGSVAAAPAGPINIGSASNATILDAAKILLGALDAAGDRYAVTGKFRPGDVRHAVADIARAEAVLGWRPEVTLEAGLTALAAWARTERAAGRI